MNYKFQIQNLVGNLYGIKFDEAEEEKRLEDEESQQDAEDAEQAKDDALEEANRSLI